MMASGGPAAREDVWGNSQVGREWLKMEKKGRGRQETASNTSSKEGRRAGAKCEQGENDGGVFEGLKAVQSDEIRELDGLTRDNQVFTCVGKSQHCTTAGRAEWWVEDRYQVFRGNSTVGSTLFSFTATEYLRVR